MSTIAMPSIVADMQAAAGSVWHTTLTVDKGSPGSQPSTPYPYILSVLDSFAVIDYYLSSNDFYMVRSRDGGRFWEYANNCQPIPQLADLKAFNTLTTGSYSVPTLVASGDSIHALWIENGAVKCISTQDQGDTWST